MPFWRFRSSLRTCYWTQYDFLCNWVTSPACGHRVIPASLYTPPLCTCGRLSGDCLCSSQTCARCHTYCLCGPIHSRDYTYCQGPHSWRPQLGTTFPLPWCISWLFSVPPCFPLQWRLLMTRRFLRSAFSLSWCVGSPAIVPGWGLLCPRSPLHIPLTSSAGLLCDFPYTAPRVLHGSSAFPWSCFLWHPRLLCRQSSLPWWWCRGTASPSLLSHSGGWLRWLHPLHSSLRSLS